MFVSPRLWVQASGCEDLAKDIGHPPGAPIPAVGEWVGLCQAGEGYLRSVRSAHWADPLDS